MQLRPDDAFERRNARRFYLCVALAIIASQIWPWPGILVRFAVGLAGLVVGYLIASAMEWLAVMAYRCPTCGTQIGRARGDLGDRVTLRCSDCNVEWDLGIRQSKKDPDDDTTASGWDFFDWWS